MILSLVTSFVLCLRFSAHRLGWLGVLVLLVWCYTGLSSITSAPELLRYCEGASILAVVLVVVVGLFWGKRHHESKCLMMLEMYPRARYTALLGESLGLWVLGQFFLLLSFAVGFVRSEGMPLLRELGEASVVTHENHYELKGRPDGKMAVKMRLMEGESLSLITFLDLKIKRDEGSESQVFKSNRETVIDSASSIVLPRSVRVNPQLEVQLVLDQVLLFDESGTWWQSFWSWGLDDGLSLFLLCVLVVLLGKHVSLEMGLSVLLTYLVLVWSSRLLDGDDMSRLLWQLERKDWSKSRFEVHWWQQGLTLWSIWVAEALGALNLKASQAYEVLSQGREWRLSLSWYDVLKACGFAALATVVDRHLVKWRIH